MICSRLLSSSFLAMLSAAGFLMTTPLFNFWPGAVIGYLAWGALCVYRSSLAVTLGSFFIGIVIGGVVFYGVRDLSLPIYMALVLGLSLYFGCIGFCSSRCIKVSPLWGTLSAAVTFAVAEFVLGATGFPFSLGAAWVNSPFSSLVSPYLGNEWQTAAYWLLTLAVLQLAWIRKAALLGGCALYWSAVGGEESHSNVSLKVALLQTNLTSDVINFPGIPGNLEQWLFQLDQLKKQLASSDAVDLVVFPESVLPGFSGDFVSLSDSILSEVKSPYVISHQYQLSEQGSVVSSNVFWDQAGDTFISNDKEYPVPGFESYLQPGEYRSSLSLDGVSVATFVCSESFFVNLLRTRARSADMLVVTVNDRLLTGSLLPEYHLRMEQLRAAELGLPILRVANSGPSAIVNSRGEVQSRLSEQQTGILTDVISVTERSFFAENYQQVFWGSLGVMLLSGYRMVFRGRKFLTGHSREVNNHVVMNAGAVIGLLGLVYVSLSRQEFQQSENVAEYKHGSVSVYDFFVRQTGVATEADQRILATQFSAFEGDLSEAQRLLKKWTFAVVDTIYGRYLLLDYGEGAFLVYKDGRVMKLKAKKLTDIAIGKPAWFRLKF